MPLSIGLDVSLTGVAAGGSGAVTPPPTPNPGKVFIVRNGVYVTRNGAYVEKPA